MPAAPFRRPAALDQVDAESIEAPGDIPLDSEVAHASAQLLLGHADDTELARLIDVIHDGGVDTVCELWAHSPATTLPGIAWRLYLIDQWGQRDLKQVRQRYNEGLAAPGVPGVPTPEAIGLDETLAANRAFLAGRLPSEQLWQLLGRMGALLRILATGASYGDTWITDDADDLAAHVTRRASALTRTSDELLQAGALARAGRLD